MIPLHHLVGGFDEHPHEVELLEEFQTQEVGDQSKKGSQDDGKKNEHVLSPVCRLRKCLRTDNNVTKTIFCQYLVIMSNTT
ncbi:MAG: hypothetical protein AUJ23_03285 [Candidatus Magasanikbacteria bacterium CG1_02_32_51]|uniref:Uncharacterized protein n=1 Tax=Candidatus Magasanikbacteria bacterium CG1_02_32_51 TaxID=1805238 RepID=A0A1J4U2H0_9BACT|nr:MAG: hypothetical protein AUJ23_03285 [Candidatus Magasanikbacteria bacterium CG1_02_32_51]